MRKAVDIVCICLFCGLPLSSAFCVETSVYCESLRGLWTDFGSHVFAVAIGFGRYMNGIAMWSQRP